MSRQAGRPAVRLWRALESRRRLQLVLLLGLMIAGAASEVVSLSAAIPFLAVLADPEAALDYGIVAAFARFYGVEDSTQLLLPLTIVFAVAITAAGCIRMVLLWANNRFAFMVALDISCSVYRNCLYRPFVEHTRGNSSDVISTITSRVGITVFVLQAMLTLGTSFLLLVSIMATLMALSPAAASGSAFVIGGSYLLVALFSRQRLRVNGERINECLGRLTKAIQEGFGGIREVILDGNHESYCDQFRRVDMPLRQAMANNGFLSSSPRIYTEAMGMVFIAGLACVLALRDGGSSTLPIVGVLALGAQRLLPALQQGYASWALYIGSKSSILDIVEILEEDTPTTPTFSKIPFKEKVQLEGVGYRYADGPFVLNDINLSIERGSRVGIVGSTGSGKSTLVDLLMGLLHPSVGRVVVDGRDMSASPRSWQVNIAHVPQSIFLLDATIAENIAFGVPARDIDVPRLHAAAEAARIASYVESQPDGYRSRIGERGVRLSGGQRQRVGIARALYKDAQVLVLDEATSALDGLTEEEVVRSLAEKSDLTLIQIAHRLSTIKDCDSIILLEDGRIHSQGTYEELCRTDAHFRRLASST